MSSSSRQYYPVVQVAGYYSSSCGYCKSKSEIDGSVHRRRRNKGSFGIYANMLPAALYDKMINRNWRRSGDFIYWPRNDNICCPQYAIRLKAADFDPRRSKHHRKVMNRLGRFLRTGSVEAHGEKRKKQSGQSSASENDGSDSISQHIVALEHEIKQAVQSLFDDSSIIALNNADHGFDLNRAVRVSQSKKMKGKRTPSPTVELSCNIVLVIMGLYRRHGLLDEAHNLSPKSIADQIVGRVRIDEMQRNHSVQNVYTVNNGFINISLLQEKASSRGQHQVPVSKRQKMELEKTNHHHSDNGGASTDHSPKHTLTTEIVSAEVRDDEFELYKKYQIAIHGDKPHEVTREGYFRFLCESSLLQEEEESQSQNGESNKQQQQQRQQQSKQFPLKGYGTYHMRYVLDNDKLIAVSVVDVLPTGWSSVYFFYDPDYAFLSLGIVSVIKEIELVRQESELFPHFRFMYLGYYIHSCPKMRYKAQYEPSELLCPVTFTWVPYTQVKPKLEQHKYCRFADDDVPPDAERQPDRPVDFSDSLFLAQRQVVPAWLVLSKFSLKEQSKEKLEEFFRLASRDVAKQVVQFISLHDDLQVRKVDDDDDDDDDNEE